MLRFPSKGLSVPSWVLSISEYSWKGNLAYVLGKLRGSWKGSVEQGCEAGLLNYLMCKYPRDAY